MKSIIVAFVILTLAVFGLLKLQQNGWEKLLLGPFPGEADSGDPAGPVVASLSAPSNFLLNVHHEGGTNHPVLILRDQNRKTLWGCTLTPRLAGKSTNEHQIRSIALNSISNSKNGYKVRLHCYWTGGGNEGGIIYLDQNLAFQSFALSW